MSVSWAQRESWLTLLPVAQSQVADAHERDQQLLAELNQERSKLQQQLDGMRNITEENDKLARVSLVSNMCG